MQFIELHKLLLILLIPEHLQLFKQFLRSFNKVSTNNTAISYTYIFYLDIFNAV